MKVVLQRDLYLGGVLYRHSPTGTEIPETITEAGGIEKCITSRTRAILPVHLFGHPLDLEPILELGRTHGIPVIEDAAEEHIAGEGAALDKTQRGSLRLVDPAF